MILHENRLPADDSHEISCLKSYFWKSRKIWNCRLLQIIGGPIWFKDNICSMCFFKIIFAYLCHSRCATKKQILNLCMLGNFLCFCCRLLFFFLILKKFFEEHHQSVKPFGSMSGVTNFCQPWSGSKLFAKVISRYIKQKSLLASKEFILHHSNP